MLINFKVISEIQLSSIFYIVGWMFCNLWVADFEVAMIVYEEIFSFGLVDDFFH